MQLDSSVDSAVNQLYPKIDEVSRVFNAPHRGWTTVSFTPSADEADALEEVPSPETPTLTDLGAETKLQYEFFLNTERQSLLGEIESQTVLLDYVACWLHKLQTHDSLTEGMEPRVLRNRHCHY